MIWVYERLASIKADIAAVIHREGQFRQNIHFCSPRSNKELQQSQCNMLPTDIRKGERSIFVLVGKQVYEDKEISFKINIILLW